MQIAQARTKAQKILADHMLRAEVPRPFKGTAYRVRYPRTSDGTLLMADSPDELQEKLAKRIQAQTRRKMN